MSVGVSNRGALITPAGALLCLTVQVHVLKWLIGSRGPSIFGQPRLLEGRSVNPYSFSDSKYHLLDKQQSRLNLPAGQLNHLQG